MDQNGCDTRNDILRRDLTEVTYTGSVTCTVKTGVLADPYTGTVINFVRGTTTSSAVQIDHVVALSDAWQKGAQQRTTEQRTEFANDPLNLQATDGPTNQQKGDGDAATWLPPAKAFRCECVARQVSVKARYSLWVTQAEHDAIAGILAKLPRPAGTGDCGARRRYGCCVLRELRRGGGCRSRAAVCGHCRLPGRAGRRRRRGGLRRVAAGLAPGEGSGPRFRWPAVLHTGPRNERAGN
ncbi:HNH endonuclease family protein [Arthrobacter sp. 162MFSha1.1]|uniref:HNH endonuclease family protein n=1 Tax=Arthrobacter sp. 162MFSha1.1 TaxID=1151119 RepID=UPI003FA45975